MEQERAVADKVAPIAWNYARALFALAQKANHVAAVVQAIRSLVRLTEEIPRLQIFLRDPRWSYSQKKAAVDIILNKIGAERLVIQFCRFLIYKGRWNYLGSIEKAFRVLCARSENVQFVQVVSATTVMPDQQEALRNILSEVLHPRSVSLHLQVDPSIIGGLVINIGSYRIDGSIKTNLRMLRARMKEGV